MSRIGQLGRKTGAALPALWLRGFGRPVALTFHGVRAQTDESGLSYGAHSFDAFADILCALKNEFDILPLSHLAEALASPRRHRRTVFLTADDGYANMATRAAPLLSEMRLPWTLFVSTRHIGGDEPEPTFVIRAFCHLMPPGRYALPSVPQIELGDSVPRSQIAARITERLIRLDAAAAGESIAIMQAQLARDGIDIAAQFPEERFLSWEMLRSLAESGVTIGAHAHWHWPLNAAQSAGTVRLQVEEPLGLLRSRVGACDAFAYPFGNVGDISPLAWQAVRAAGYAYGFTTLSGTLDGGANPYLLPRYTFASTERNFGAMLPLLRGGNRRLARFAATLEAVPSRHPAVS